MPAPTRFAFVRHGKTPGLQPRGPARDAESLSESGQAQACAAGRWLAAQGLRPDLVVHTETARTRETAQAVVAALGTDIPLEQFRHGFGDLADLNDKLATWTANHSAAFVLFCGHHTSQQALARALGRKLPRTERVVVVLARAVDGWQLEALATCRAQATGFVFEND
jgi:phosphohistidine phosphatase SixA